MSRSRLMHLAADLSHVHTDYLWSLPGEWENYSYYSGPEFYEDITRIAARGKMDMLFFGDSGGTPEDYGGDFRTAVRLGTRWPRHDMGPMIPIMSRAAKGIGFGITMSTTYQHPFHVARVFNGLDHVTGGRIAWNAVTSRSKNEAANYGYSKMVEHDARYDRAQEHLKVACMLWESTEPDMLKLDKQNQVFGDPDKVHALNFEGKYYNVRGPLPALPSPQGRPVIIQAGQSGPGMDLATSYADLQFSTRRTIESMKAHRQKLDTMLVDKGRSPRDLGILWSVRIQVAESLADAKRKEQAYLDAIPPEAGLIELSSMYGLDFSTLPKGARLIDAAEMVRAQNVHWGSFEELLKTTDPALTIEEFGRQFVTDRILVAAGTPAQIADRLEMLHEETGANGGFMLARGFSAQGNIREFVDYVVPELQRRGLSRKEYAGDRLKDNLLD